MWRRIRPKVTLKSRRPNEILNTSLSTASSPPLLHFFARRYHRSFNAQHRFFFGYYADSLPVLRKELWYWWYHDRTRTISLLSRFHLSRAAGRFSTNRSAHFYYQFHFSTNPRERNNGIVESNNDNNKKTKIEDAEERFGMRYCVRYHLNNVLFLRSFFPVILSLLPSLLFLEALLGVVEQSATIKTQSGIMIELNKHAHTQIQARRRWILELVQFVKVTLWRTRCWKDN